MYNIQSRSTSYDQVKFPNVFRKVILIGKITSCDEETS